VANILRRYQTVFVLSLIVPSALYINNYGKSFIVQKEVLLSVLIYSLIFYYGAVKNYWLAQLGMKIFISLHLIAFLTLFVGFLSIL
jgi:hypothetical protein